MKLSALEIRKHEFSRTFRGCDPEEVDAFLNMVSRQWEELEDERRRTQDRLRELEAKLQHYQKVEEALQQALQTARETSENAIRNAEKKAELIVQEAEARANDIKRNAEQERTQMKQDTARLTGRRKEVAARLRAFLMSEMELLAHFESDDPVGFIKLMPSDQGMRLAMQAGPSGEGQPLDTEPYRPTQSASAQPAAPEPEPDEAAAAPAEDEALAEARAGAATDAAPEDESRTAAGSAPGEDREPDAAPAAEASPAPDERPEPVYPEFGEAAGRVQATPTSDASFEPPAIEPKPPAYEPPAQPRIHERTAAEAAPAERAREAPAAEDEPAPPPKKDEVRSGPGWIVHPVVSRPSDDTRRTGSGTSQRSVAGSSSEIEKIRRILNDLD